MTTHDSELQYRQHGFLGQLSLAMVETVDPTSDLRWQQLVEQRPSDLFHAPAWIRVLRETYNFEPRALLSSDAQGRPQAGVTYTRISDMLGDRVAVMPFSDYCDPLVDEPGAWEALAEQLLAEGCLLTVRCLHNDLPLADKRFSLVNRARWHGIDLNADLDALWTRVDEGSRRAIRKARNNGITVRVAEQKPDLRAFFELHLRVRKLKYRMLAQPYRFFEQIWQQFTPGAQGFLMLAEHEGQVIGGVYYLRWKDTLYYKFNASDPTHLALRPNDLVLWQGMTLARELGCTYLDLGLSDWDQEGLIRYKRKFATDEKTISFLRHTPPGAVPPQAVELRTLLPQLTNLFTDASVPDAVTEQAGDQLYRLFC